MDKAEKKELEMFAKEKKLDFYHSLCLNIQKSFPLDNSILTHLAYIDPAKVDHDNTEKAFKEICDRMPHFIKPEEKDEVIVQLRILQMNKADFGEDYEDYCLQVQDESKLFIDLPRIDEIWSPIIKKKKYYFLGKFIKAVLSFIHSTSSVEGSVKDLRNVSGSLSHGSSDKMCTARLALMSAIRSAKSECCFDFNQNNKEHRINWLSSWKLPEKVIQDEVDNEDDLGSINESESE